jgi:hypothetical protein
LVCDWGYILSPLLGIWASAQQNGVAGGSYESIATVTVGSGGTSVVNFNSIPQTYTHLQIRCIARRTGSGSGSATDWLRLNSDSGNNYTWHYMFGVSGTVASGASTSISKAYVVHTVEGGYPANVFANSIIDIYDYSSTNKNKTIRSTGGDENGSSGIVKVYTSAWLSTSAVTSITIDVDANDIAQYSQFALYGIKGA